MLFCFIFSLSTLSTTIEHTSGTPEAHGPHPSGEEEATKLQEAARSQEAREPPTLLEEEQSESEVERAGDTSASNDTPLPNISRAILFTFVGVLVGAPFSVGLTLWVVNLFLPTAVGPLELGYLGLFLSLVLTGGIMGGLVWVTGDLVDAALALSIAVFGAAAFPGFLSVVGAIVLGVVAIGVSGYLIYDWSVGSGSTSLETVVIVVLASPFAFPIGANLGIYAGILASPIVLGALTGLFGALGHRFLGDLLTSVVHREDDVSETME